MQFNPVDPIGPGSGRLFKILLSVSKHRKYSPELCTMILEAVINNGNWKPMNGIL